MFKYNLADLEMGKIYNYAKIVMPYCIDTIEPSESIYIW